MRKFGKKTNTKITDTINNFVTFGDKKTKINFHPREQSAPI